MILLEEGVMYSDREKARRRPTRWRVALMVMLGLVLSLHWAAFAAEEGKKYEGKVVYQKTVLGKEYRIETIENEPGNYRIRWGEQELKWEPKPWYDDELKAKGPLLYTEWLQPLYYPYTIPLEEREKFDAFDVQNSGTFLGPFSAPSFEDQFEAHLYAPGAEYRRDKTGFEWNKWYPTSKRVSKWRWDPEPLPEQDGQPYRKYLFLFRSPRDLLKVGFLQIQYHGKNKEDDNYLYVPTVRKVRRLATANRQDVIGGLVLRQEQNALMTPIHHYKMLRAELCKLQADVAGLGGGGEPANPDENAKRLDGLGEPCWVYETTPFREDWWFAKQINWVGMFSLTNWYTLSYDREGRLIQTMTWIQVLSPPGQASSDGVPNCCGRKTHLAWGPSTFKDFTTGFWVHTYPSLRTLNPPIPDEFYNVQTLIQEPKTIDFYR